MNDNNFVMDNKDVALPYIKIVEKLVFFPVK